jgi:pyroglutamyl-peptidase
MSVRSPTSRPVVLLTGFGPFPKVPENASSRLVPALATAAQQQFPAVQFHAAILPTEWALAPVRLSALMAEWSPTVVLQFGVSPRAKGFVFETRAHNEQDTAAADAIGCQPDCRAIAADGADVLRSRLPVAALVSRLRALGLPAVRSHNAGKYLCNALLYHGLVHQPQLVGFIHLPTDLPTEASTAHKLTFLGALAGGVAIVATCLDACAAPNGAPFSKSGNRLKKAG